MTDGAEQWGNRKENDLGTVLCRRCRTIIATLPTRGVKTFYAVCEPCRSAAAQTYSGREAACK